MDLVQVFIIALDWRHYISARLSIVLAQVRVKACHIFKVNNYDGSCLIASAFEAYYDQLEIIICFRRIFFTYFVDFSSGHLLLKEIWFPSYFLLQELFDALSIIDLYGLLPTYLWNDDRLEDHFF